MRYVNVKTGAIHDFYGKINAEDWVECPASAEAPENGKQVSEDAAVRKSKRHNKSVEGNDSGRSRKSRKASSIGV